MTDLQSRRVQHSQVVGVDNLSALRAAIATASPKPTCTSASSTGENRRSQNTVRKDLAAHHGVSGARRPGADGTWGWPPLRLATHKVFFRKQEFGAMTGIAEGRPSGESLRCGSMLTEG